MTGNTDVVVIGAMLKEFISRSIVWQLAFEARHPGALDGWAKDAERRQLRQAGPERGEAWSDERPRH